MRKIDERIDLSREALEIDIESPVFYCLLQDLNKEIQRCIKKVYDGDFEAGEIAVKLAIEIPDDYENFAKTNEFGELMQETFKYKKPRFEHKVTTTLKKKFVQEGIFTDKRDVQLVDGKFIAVPIKDAQMHISDYE